jgi:hypothetical protein
MRLFALVSLLSVAVALVAASASAQLLTGKMRQDEKLHDPWVQKRLKQLGASSRPEAKLLTASVEPGDKANCEWAARVLKMIDSVKVGTSRGQLSKLLFESGGISTMTQQTFFAPTCPFIKVDVKFRIVGRPERDAAGRLSPERSPKDVVSEISKPYLQFPIID